ncbi:MAG TPA: hypothetical protein DEP28_06145 [Bacteroidetes bacterium]|nr:hypothetical protein [Bacteroidota bacterium]
MKKFKSNRAIKKIKYIIFASLLLLLNGNINAQWQPEFRLTNNTGSSINCDLTSSGNSLYAVWSDYRAGGGQIYFKKSNDGGNSWGSDINITNSMYGGNMPKVSVSGNDIHVIYFENNPTISTIAIYYKRSTDNGNTWEPAVRLSTNNNNTEKAYISSSGSMVYVIFLAQNVNPFQLFLRVSSDGGATWGPNINVSNETSTLPNLSDITSSGLNVHIVSSARMIPERDDIIHLKSTNAGVSWLPYVILTNDSSSFATSPSISLSGNNIHTVWTDINGIGSQIFYSRSSNGGSSFSNRNQLTFNSPQSSLRPDITSSGNNVHIAYDVGTGGIGNEVYYLRSINSGVTFDSAFKVSTSNSGAKQPSVATAMSSVNIIWQDVRFGSLNEEIFYRKNLTGNPMNIRQIESEFPEGFTLSQNYPNPFNPSTKISFALPSAGKVTLKVYDVTGKLISKILNDKFTSGNYEVTFNASNLPSGVYFYKLESNNYSESKKMILIK